MKLNKVVVDGLFGMFRHEIPVNTADNITIVHCENGMGKTSILRLIDAFFNKRYLELRKIRFRELVFVFDSGDRICITRHEKASKSERYSQSKTDVELSVERTYPNNETKNDKLGLSKYDDVVAMAHEVAANFPYITQVAPDVWSDLRSNEVYHAAELVDMFGDILPRRRAKVTTHEWLGEITNDVDVLLIET